MKVWVIVGVLALVWLMLAVSYYTSPVVVLHYSATASKPVGYFFNEEDDVTKEYIYPGTSVALRTRHSRNDNYFIDVSLPQASRDGIHITQPFSRVDVYIGADTRITRTVIKTEFLARFSAE